MNHHCFLADQVLHHVEVGEASCLLEVVGDHEVEMEDVQMEVGLVEVVANQVVVHHVAAVVEDSCLDKVPDDAVGVVVVETVHHPAMEVASFLVEGDLLEVVGALVACVPFDPSLVPRCFAVVVEVVAVTAAVVVVVAAVGLMSEAWEAVVVVQP